MAKTSNINIVEAGKTLADNIRIPLASGAVAPGDLVQLVTIGTNTCVAVAATVSELFCGIATNYVATAGDLVNICTNCVIEVESSGTIPHAGYGVIYSAGGNGTNWTLAPCASATDSTDKIGDALDAIASGARGLVKINTQTLKVLKTAAAIDGATSLGIFRISIQA